MARHITRTGFTSVPLLLPLIVLLFLGIADQVGAEFLTVTRVVDGDTLVLQNGERVRLIGVDTPETKDPRKPVERFGQEATDFTRQMVEGKGVWIEFDQANAHLGHKDKYGRTLAYVFRDDGKFLNAEIIEKGYGHAYTSYPFKYSKEFRTIERQARDNRRGLWSETFRSGDKPQFPSGNASPTLARSQSRSSDVSRAGVPQSTGAFEPGPMVGRSPTGKPIYEGTRGGLYHYSKSGRKVYHRRGSSNSSRGSSSRGSASRGGRR